MNINQLFASNRPQTRPLDRAQEDPSARKIFVIAITTFSAIVVLTQFLNPSLKEAKLIEELDKWAGTQKQSSVRKVEIAKQKILKYSQGDTIDLILSDLDLSSLPTCLFKKLTNLKTLYSSNNHLTSFNGTRLSNLAVLNLFNNQLTSFSGAGLSNLKHLCLTHNQLTSFDGAKLSNLTDLYLNNNQLTSFSGAGLSNLKTLHLKTNQLTSFDGTGLRNLEYLNLTENQLESFSGAGLSSLKTLHLDNNQLRSLIGIDFPNLSFFSIGNNPIKELPTTLSQYPNLRDLSAEGTKIPKKSIDTILDSCKALRPTTAQTNVNYSSISLM